MLHNSLSLSLSFLYCCLFDWGSRQKTYAGCTQAKVLCLSTKSVKSTSARTTLSLSLSCLLNKCVTQNFPLTLSLSVSFQLITIRNYIQNKCLVFCLSVARSVSLRFTRGKLFSPPQTREFSEVLQILESLNTTQQKTRSNQRQTTDPHNAKAQHSAQHINTTRMRNDTYRERENETKVR